MSRSHAQLRDVSRPIPRDPVGRAPAHDADAELLLAAAFLVEPEAAEQVSGLVAAADFWVAELRPIAEAAFALLAAGAPVGIVEVKTWLREQELLEQIGGAVELARIAEETPGTVHLERAAKRVRARARVRAMAEAAHWIVAEAYDPKLDVDEYLARSEHAVSAVARAAGDGSVTTLRDALAEVFQRLHDDSAKGGASSLPTGFRALDPRLGGFFGGELTILAGRPGMGKTGVAMEMALQIAGVARRDGEEANSVLVFSQEMKREQLVTRSICTQARVNIASYRAHNLKPVEWERLQAAAVWMVERPVLIDDRCALSPLDIRAKVRRVQRDEQRAGRRLGLVIVDYLQLCSARAFVSERSNREQEVAFVSRELKRLAKELDIPVLALAQLNRAVDRAKDKRPTLSDLRESGAIEQDADSVIFVHREEYYLRDHTPPDQKGVAELIVAKGRMGGEGTAKLQYFSECGLFADGAA